MNRENIKLVRSRFAAAFHAPCVHTGREYALEFASTQKARGPPCRTPSLAALIQRLEQYFQSELHDARPFAGVQDLAKRGIAIVAVGVRVLSMIPRIVELGAKFRIETLVYMLQLNLTWLGGGCQVFIFTGASVSQFVMLLICTTLNLFVIRVLRVVVTVLSSNMISSWCGVLSHNTTCFLQPFL